MELGLFQQQKLKLVMTTELRQAITILQYSSIELKEFLEHEALENPLIEVGDSSWSYEKKPSNSSSGDKKEDYFVSSEESLQEHLTKQLSLIRLNEEEKRLLIYLICSLDESGYLKEDLEQVASKFSVQMNEVEFVLTQLQQLDPAGIGARTLQECILLQLSRLSNRNTIAEQIITTHFEAFAGRKWDLIKKDLGVTIHEIQQVIDLIQTLNPRPGLRYSNEKVEYIVPDLIIEKVGDTYKVAVNDASMPPFHINEFYEQSLRKTDQPELVTYLTEKYQRFQWIQKSIEQRNMTLIKVMSKIIEKQQAFFYEGANTLRPLTLKEVAEEIEMHESTVSRATNKKYVQSPFGLYELKYFFTSGIQADNEDDVSSNMVKKAIEDLVAEEDKTKPLSDQKIVTLLKEKKEYNVSRRTVAKYRDQLNIPSSTKRKRLT